MCETLNKSYNDSVCCKQMTIMCEHCCSFNIHNVHWEVLNIMSAMHSNYCGNDCAIFTYDETTKVNNCKNV